MADDIVECIKVNQAAGLPCLLRAVHLRSFTETLSQQGDDDLRWICVVPGFQHAAMLLIT
nr:hypothetical protein [Methanothrix sp.]